MDNIFFLSPTLKNPSNRPQMKSTTNLSTTLKNLQQTQVSRQNQSQTGSLPQYQSERFYHKKDGGSIQQNSVTNFDLLLQNRPQTSILNEDFSSKRKTSQQPVLRAHNSETAYLQKQTRNASSNRMSIQTNNNMNNKHIKIVKPNYNTVNMNFQIQATPSIVQSASNNPDQFASTSIYKQLDIEVNDQQSLKTLKTTLVTLITMNQKNVKEYLNKLNEINFIINRMEYEENLRSIPELQELFHFCRDKIEISTQSLKADSELQDKKREIEIQAIEMSTLRNKILKQEQQNKMFEMENKDLKKQVLLGIDQYTNLYKSSVQDQSRANNMKRKVEELELGLLTLGDDRFGDQLQRQSRLKTTIHLLIQENNNLKKELSFMKNQGEEQRKEIERLKKKINHLVMKIDEQRKEKEVITRRMTTILSDNIDIDMNHSTDSAEGMNKIDVQKIDEFEQLEDKEELHKANQKINELIHGDNNKFVTKSNFNLQGPYWKKRTNSILRHERQIREAIKDEGKFLKSQIFQFPSIFMNDTRMLRMASDFKCNYINHDFQKILKELNEMGVNNFVETVMSLKTIEIKKNVQVIAREFLQSNTLNRLWNFLLSQMLDFFLKDEGNNKLLFRGISRLAPKILGVKEIKIWYKEILNNYVWTFNQDSVYENHDLNQKTEDALILSSLLESRVPVQCTFKEYLCLFVPIIEYKDKIIIGLVQLCVSKDLIREDGYDFGFDQQLGALIISELLTGLLAKEFVDRTGTYVLRKRIDTQRASIQIVQQRGLKNIYQKLEQCMIETLDIDRVKILFHIKDKILTLSSEGEIVSFDQKTDSIMTFTLHNERPLIVFMPYSHPSFNIKIDLDSQLPLNCIPMRLINHQIIGVVQYENKLVKNRPDPNQQIALFTDEGIVTVINEIANYVSIALSQTDD